jgi:alkylation response protein AidB-like acyl-CoA dehydrogenase
MYDLHLTAEQLEFRETVRDFVAREIKPVALHPNRLQDFQRPLPLELIDKAAQMGLRTLALSEEAGGAGADKLTCCIVMEELAAGDADIAATLAQTSEAAHVLFDQMMAPTQRERFLPQFVTNDRYHLAVALGDGEGELAWNYHRPRDEPRSGISAVRRGAEWVVNGVAPFVANAPVAELFAVAVKTDPESSGSGVLLVPRGAAGLAVSDAAGVAEDAENKPTVKWFHGTAGKLVLKDCRVSIENLLEKQIALPSGDVLLHGGMLQAAAINLGIGRAAYEAAVEYTKLRRQGGRQIVEHQAIGTILADMAIKLEAARNMVWKAAWASDHPDACPDHSLPHLPLQTMSKIFVSEVVHEVTESAAECFGAMGVMLDMPLPKYVHDALVFIHSGVSNSVAKFRVAEAVADFRRSVTPKV